MKVDAWAIPSMTKKACNVNCDNGKRQRGRSSLLTQSKSLYRRRRLQARAIDPFFQRRAIHFHLILVCVRTFSAKHYLVRVVFAPGRSVPLSAAEPEDHRGKCAFADPPWHYVAKSPFIFGANRSNSPLAPTSATDLKHGVGDTGSRLGAT